jgi:hypothetical protein
LENFTVNVANKNMAGRRRDFDNFEGFVREKIRDFELGRAGDECAQAGKEKRRWLEFDERREIENETTLEGIMMRKGRKLHPEGCDNMKTTFGSTSDGFVDVESVE